MKFIYERSWFYRSLFWRCLEHLISLSKYQHLKQRSPFPWRSKSKALVWRVMSERLSSTQSSNSLRSVACQDEPIVRRAISGTELQPNSDEPAAIGAPNSLFCFCVRRRAVRMANPLSSLSFFFHPSPSPLITAVIQVVKYACVDKCIKCC